VISLGGYSILPRIEGNELALLLLAFLYTAYENTQQTLRQDKKEMKEDMKLMSEDMMRMRKEDKEDMMGMRKEDKLMSQITAFFTLFVSVAAAYFNYAYTTFEIAKK
jgi:hypothetical protein